MNFTKDKDLNAAKTRLTNAQAERTELKVAIMKREYIPIATINKQWAEQATRVKQRLLVMPGRLASVLKGREITAQQVEATAQEIIVEILNELADLPSLEE